MSVFDFLFWLLAVPGSVSLIIAVLATVRYFRQQSGPGYLSPRERGGPW